MTERFPGDERPQSTSDDRHSLAGSYALDALSDEERRAYEQLLEESDSARTESTELADTAVLLGLAATPEAPRPELKSSIMAMLDSTPQLPAVESNEKAPSFDAGVTGAASPVSAAPTSATATPASPASAPTSVSVSSAEQKARARWFTRPVTALAAVAAASALIVGGVLGTNALRSAEEQQQLAQSVEQIVAAADSQKVSTEIERGGLATLVYSPGLERSAVLIDGLESLTDEQIYELWYIDEQGEAVPAGLFSMPEEGGMQRVVLDGSFEPGHTIGITVEDAEGAETPSDDLVVAIPTSA